MVGLGVLGSCRRRKSGQERVNRGLARHCRGIASYSDSSLVVMERNRVANEGSLVANVCFRRQKGGLVMSIEHKLCTPNGNDGSKGAIVVVKVVVIDG